MEEILTLNDPAQVSSLVKIIHDCRFDKDKISLNPESSTLDITFYREAWEKKKIVSKLFFFKKVQVPVLECTLRIQYVESYKIHEGNQAGPGSEDFFNEFIYHSEKKEIWISPVISKGIEIKVRQFEVSVRESDHVVGDKTHYLFFSF